MVACIQSPEKYSKKDANQYSICVLCVHPTRKAMEGEFSLSIVNMKIIIECAFMFTLCEMVGRLFPGM